VVEEGIIEIIQEREGRVGDVKGGRLKVPRKRGE